MPLLLGCAPHEGTPGTIHVPSGLMSDPVKKLASAPISTTREAFADLGIDGRDRPWLYRSACVVAAITLPLFLVEWLRPFDIRMIASPLHVVIVGVIGCGAITAAAVSGRWRPWARTVVSILGVTGVVLLAGLAGLLLVFGGAYRNVVSVHDVAGTGASVVVMDAGVYGPNEVVLRRKLGPIPRERVLLDTDACWASLEEAGPRSVKVDVAGSSDCTAASGTYVITLEDDGWSTRTEKVDR